MKFYLYLAIVLSIILGTPKAFSGDLENSLSNSLKALKSSAVDYKSACGDCAVKEQTTHPLVKLFSRENNQNIELTLLSEDEVNKLFKELASNQDIPFKYPVDGCYARAMAMVQIMEAKGLIAGKAFVEGRLYVDSKVYGEIGWGYHVAPVVMVKKGSATIPYIIDPSLFDHPVTFENWKNKMLEKPKAVKSAEYFTNRFAYGPFDKQVIKTKYDEDEMEDAKEDNKRHLRMIDMMSFSEGSK